MKKASFRQNMPRRRAIIELISAEARTIADIRRELRPRPSLRTLMSDLRWLQVRLSDGMRRARHRGGDGRVTYQFIGIPPLWIGDDIAVLSQIEFAALVAARGMLRIPDEQAPGLERANALYAGTLAQSLDKLITRLGLATEARAIAPDTVAVSRFGAAAEKPGIFADMLVATCCRDAVTFAYNNNKGEHKQVHAAPLRLVFIRNEWHCFAFADGKVKQYRLTRMDGLRRVREQPRGRPVSNLEPSAVIDSSLRTAFGATGSDRMQDRRAVVLAVSPEAWPYLRGPTWGDKQTWDDHPADLPTNWRRLRFVTTGLDECRHFVLGMGAAVRAEAPKELVDWITVQAQGLLKTGSRSRQRRRHPSKGPVDSSLELSST